MVLIYIVHIQSILSISFYNFITFCCNRIIYLIILYLMYAHKISLYAFLTILNIVLFSYSYFVIFIEHSYFVLMT